MRYEINVNSEFLVYDKIAREIYSINIPSMNEVKVSRRLRHKGEKTPSCAPMCGDGDPHRPR